MVKKKEKIEKPPVDFDKEIMANNESIEFNKRITGLINEFITRWSKDEDKYPADLVSTILIMMMVNAMVVIGGTAASIWSDPLAFYRHLMSSLPERCMINFEKIYTEYIQSPQASPEEKEAWSILKRNLH